MLDNSHSGSHRWERKGKGSDKQRKARNGGLGVGAVNGKGRRVGVRSSHREKNIAADEHRFTQMGKKENDGRGEELTNDHTDGEGRRWQGF